MRSMPKLLNTRVQDGEPTHDHVAAVGREPGQVELVDLPALDHRVAQLLDARAA